MKAEAQHDVRPPLPAEDVAKPPSATPPPLQTEEDGHAASTSSEGAPAEQPLGPAPSTNMYDQYSGLGIFTAVVIDAGGGGASTALDPRQMTSMVVEHPSVRPPPIQCEGPATANGIGNGNGNGNGLPSKSMRAKSLPEPGQEGQLLRLLTSYCSIVARHPCLLILLYALIFGALIGIAWRPLDVTSDFSAFIRADGDAMRRRDAYAESMDYLNQQTGRRLRARDDESAQFEDAHDSMDAEPLQHNLVSDEVIELKRIYGPDGGRILQAAVNICLQRVLTILYKPKSGNVLGERVLQDIREFEISLRKLPGWKHICGEMVDSYYRPMCNPGQSFGAFSWPTKSRPPDGSASDQLYTISFNAEGPDLLRSPAVLAYLQQAHKPFTGGIDQYLPKDFEPPQQSPPDSDSSTGQASGLRSTFTFLINIGVEGDDMSVLRRNTDRGREAFKRMIEEDVYPFLHDYQSEYMDVYYYGAVISSYEVSKTLQNDVFWAIASVSFVTCYLWLHTRSLVLSVLSLGIIFASVPLSYVLTPLSKTTIASFLSLFLVSGIGCDVVFVFTDFWEQSVQVERSIGRRLAWVLLHAGRNCLATSLTTSASFFANLASCLQPLREFGLFMGLAVTGAYLLVMLFLPPIVVIHDCCCCGSSQSRKSPESGKDAGELDTLAIVPAGEATTLGDVTPQSSWSPPLPRRKLTRYLLVALANRIAACPAMICCSTFLMIVGFIVGVALGHEFDRGVPDIFPDEHNQVAGNKMQEKFAVMKAAEVLPVEVAGGEVCRANGSWHRETACILHWCESELMSSARTGEVSCWHEGFSDACQFLHLRTRFASPVEPDMANWTAPWHGAVQQATGGNVVSFPGPPSKLKTLVLENWESGDMVARGFYKMGTTTVHRPQAQGVADCTTSALCFWGQHHCSLDMHGWPRFGQFNTTSVAGSRRLSTAAVDTRQLDAAVETLRSPTVPGDKRVHLTIVWGLRPAKFTPLVGKPNEVWSFDPNFEPDNPWAQRAMFAMCDNLPSYLLVYQSKCWIREFKVFLLTGRARFPTRDFKATIGNWFPRTLEAQENLWRAKDGKVLAAQLSFSLDLDKNSASGKLLDHKKLWDDYVEVKNSQSAMSGNRAWHTAQAWVRAEAETAVVESTIDTIIISAACAWGGMLIFTCDPVLAFFVLGLVLGIIGGLAFFMVTIVGWKIGSIEVISLVIFVGYSVTYSLHVAHSYSEAYVDTTGPELDDIADPQETTRDGPGLIAITDGNTTVVEVPPVRAVKKLSPFEMRKRRATMSLVHIGGAVLSSAVSTIGSSIFLLCCTMIIFVKLGAVVIAVTLLSVTFALLTLPALLMLCGPSPDPWYKRWAHAVMRPRKQSHED